MGVNRGKQFEKKVHEQLKQLENVSVDRLHDQTTGYRGSSNICDFIVYKKPIEIYIECKSTYGNTLSIHSNPKVDKNGIPHGFYGNISDAQWEGLLEKSEIDGCIAGILCWWIDRDITKFIPISMLQQLRDLGYKSIRFDISERDELTKVIELEGKKKRVFFEYDMTKFLEELNLYESRAGR